MINLQKPNKARIFADIQLEDGKFVEFKANIPKSIDALMPLIVAISNSQDGGFIVFGVDSRTMSVVGIKETSIDNLKNGIRELSIGIDYSIIHKVIDDKNIVILDIKKTASTSFFSRIKTSPARQIAYKFKEISSEKYTICQKEQMRYSKVYKYMTLDAFLTSLYTGTWRFFEPSKWKDKFEQRFYCAKYNFPAANGNTPQVFATCVTKEKNSEAAWKVYSNGQGLGTHCVQIELDIVELRKQIRYLTHHQFEEKSVEYKREIEILNLHKKRTSYYKQYFSSFELDSFLKLLSLKRDAYAYEKELRLFIIPPNVHKRNKGRNVQHMDIPIKWNDVIQKVRIDKKCSDAELVSVLSACISSGIYPQINNYNFIGKKINSNGLKVVEFERFDIDDMPGTSCITIK